MRTRKTVNLLIATFATLFAAAAVQAAPIGYSVQSDGDNQLYSIDLATGIATAVGPVGFDDVEGLSFQPGTGTLYGVDDITEQLITIDTNTGAGTVVGPLGVSITDMGLAFDGAGNLWMATDVPAEFYSINPATGAATTVGAQGQRVTGLTASGTTLFGLGGDNTDNLVTIDTLTGAATSIGALTNVSLVDGGLDFDGAGTLWGIEDGGDIFTINTATGLATVQATTRTGFESLAIQGVPAPATLALLGLGLVGLGFQRRRCARHHA